MSIPSIKAVPRRLPGQHTVDIRDYGARVGSGNAAVTTAAIQAAIAAAAAAGHSTVWIPSGSWYVNDTLWHDYNSPSFADRSMPHIHFQGEGFEASRIVSGNVNHKPVLAIGMLRAPRPSSASGSTMNYSTFRPDVTSYLSGAGTRYGIRSRGATASGAVQYCRLINFWGAGNAGRLTGANNLPTWYETETELTLLCAFRVNNLTPESTAAVGFPLITLGHYSAPTPFHLCFDRDEPNKITWRFRTTSSYTGTIYSHTYQWVHGWATNDVVRLVIQVKFSDRSVTVWQGINTTTLSKPTVSSVGTAFSSGGSRFVHNDIANLQVYGHSWNTQSNAGEDSYANYSAGSHVPPDITLLGMALRQNAPYTVSSSTIAPGDSSMFPSTSDAQVITSLPLTDGSQTDGRTGINSMDMAGLAMLWPNPWTHINWVYASMADLTIHKDGTYYGAGLAMGAVLNFKATRCQFIGGFQGLASYSRFVSYKADYEQCEFFGGDAGTYFATDWASLENCWWRGAHRTAIRNHASALSFRNCVVSHCNETALCVYRGHGVGETGLVEFDNLQVDNEQDNSPQVAMIWDDGRNDSGSLGYKLSLRNAVYGVHQAGIPTVLLDNRNPLGGASGFTNKCEIDGGNYPGDIAVSIKGGNWQVNARNMSRHEIESTQTPTGTPIVYDTASSAGFHRVELLPGFAGPPRMGVWYAGPFRINLATSGVRGMPRLLRINDTLTFGTSTQAAIYAGIEGHEFVDEWDRETTYIYGSGYYHNNSNAAQTGSYNTTHDNLYTGTLYMGLSTVPSPSSWAACAAGELALPTTTSSTVYSWFLADAATGAAVTKLAFGPLYRPRTWVPNYTARQVLTWSNSSAGVKANSGDVTFAATSGRALRFSAGSIRSHY